MANPQLRILMCAAFLLLTMGSCTGTLSTTEENSEFDSGRSGFDGGSRDAHLASLDAEKPSIDAPTQIADADEPPVDAPVAVVDAREPPIDVPVVVPDSGPPERDAGPMDPPGCRSPLRSGTYAREVVISGQTREYELLIPDGADSNRPIPLVFAFHARDGHIADARSYGFQNAAQARGDKAIFVFPQALLYPGEGALGWEISCSGIDMRFMDAIYEAVVAESCIDPDRVFASGFSWGADMSIAFGCCRHEIVRAIAPMSGTAWGRWADACTTDAPAYRMTIGTADGVYPLDDVHAVTDIYRRRNGCGESTHPIAPSPCLSFDGCDDRAIECVYPGMGHALPDGYSTDIWNFFRRFD